MRLQVNGLLVAASGSFAYNQVTLAFTMKHWIRLPPKKQSYRIMFGKALYEDQGKLRDGLQRPWLVIENALVPDFAEELREDLLTTDAWSAEDRSIFSATDQERLHDDYSFTRDGFRIESAKAPDSVRRLYAFLSSAGTLKWISNLSGRLCNGFSASCTRYRGSDHLTSHNDYYVTSLDGKSVSARTVTFNYYLTRNWDAKWGGNFVWEKPHAVITPSFNTLVMFLVSHHSEHHVEQVKDAATEPRLAITGWFSTTRKIGEKRLSINPT